MKYEKIIYEKDGNIGRITLNYPEKLNTWDFPGQGGMSDQFDGALKEAVDDDDIKVVVIKGAGRCLSAGHDLTKVGFVYGMGTGKTGERRASQRARLKVDHKFIAEHLQNIFLCPK